jgi:glycosyltransferase involved in cell wall biosynthesis
MIAFSHFPTDTRIRREAEALAGRGDMVDAIGLRKPGDNWPPVLNGVRLLQVSAPRYRGPSVLAYLTGYAHFFAVASALVTLRHLRRPYHVIQVHTLPDFMVFAALLPKLLGARVVLDVHDLMPELLQCRFRLRVSHILVRLAVWVERLSVAFADRAIAVHHPHLDALCGHGNPRKKFIVLHNLPDPRMMACPTGAVPAAGFGLIYHGTLARRNGLAVALEAVAQVKDRIPGLRFRIVGEGDDLPRLAGLVRALGLSDIVTISPGMIPIQSLVPTLLAADVGVVPLLYDEFTRFMLPVKLLEYVALGKPVICSRTETIAAYFDADMVRFVEPGNAGDLAAQVLDLFRHPAARSELASKADRFNREHRWSDERRRYFAMLDALVAAPEPERGAAASRPAPAEPPSRPVEPPEPANLKGVKPS